MPTLLGYNYFVSDPDGAEVYQLHHHSKVVASIPEKRDRQRLLGEMSDYPDLFEDCSGYTSEVDDEETAPDETDLMNPPGEP